MQQAKIVPFWGKWGHTPGIMILDQFRLRGHHPPKTAKNRQRVSVLAVAYGTDSTYQRPMVLFPCHVWRDRVNVLWPRLSSRRRTKRAQFKLGRAPVRPVVLPCACAVKVWDDCSLFLFQCNSMFLNTLDINMLCFGGSALCWTGGVLSSLLAGKTSRLCSFDIFPQQLLKPDLRQARCTPECIAWQLFLGYYYLQLAGWAQSQTRSHANCITTLRGGCNRVDHPRTV